MTTLVLRLEPLRQRRHDLALLAQNFLERANERWGCHCGGFTPAATAAIESYDWPGNLRELARVVDTAHVQARTRSQADGRNGGLLIDVDDLPASIRGNLGAAYLPPVCSAAGQAARRAADRDRAPADRDGAEQGPSKQVTRRRAPGHLPTPALSPDQGTQPARRFRARSRDVAPAAPAEPGAP